MNTLSGQVIRGYELHELIGVGGFGEVYRATQTVVDREVAVKIILPQYANQPEFIRRFEAEAKTVARLDHLHIVSLYDYWRDPSGAYLVLRWLRGGSLKEYIAEHGALQPPTAARIFTQIAGALSTAHRLGVVHRDVKPANILLDDERNAYLSDFGIAKSSLEEKSAQSKITSESSLTGSAGYISPEQINLAPITPRSDIYSMTLVLYEMLTGQHAYPEATTSIALFVKHTNERLPALPNVPDQINNILQKGAAKNPDDRYDDIMTMAAEFRDAMVSTGLVNVKSSSGIVHDFDTSSFMNAVGFRPEDIVNPYKGLHAFQESDAEDFFGREALTADILDKMDENHPLARFIAVVGPSGSGKSSVVKAGVIPELRKDALPGSEDWYYVEMVPGANPMVELQEALTRVSSAPMKNLYERLMADSKALHQVVKEIVPLASELVIVIDQFEEAFTFGDEGVRSHFLQSLYEAIIAEDSRLRVLTTLRADFYDRPLSEARFGQLIQQRTVVVLPLTVEELERAITAPASQVQVFYERGLPAQIVTEVVDQPGVLPMLQYALTELFERREDQLLTHQAYQEIGGVLGALARRAEEIYRDLDADRQEATKQLFLRLVTLGEGSEDTRRRALQSEALAAAPDKKVMQEVIDMFSGYRLLTTDRDPATRTPTVEVAHEALIRQWQRLRGWLRDAREDVRLQRLLAAEAQEWDENNRDASFLLRGGRLVQFEDWYRTSTVALTPTDFEFIEASVAERQRVEEAERIRLLREREAERTARQRLQLLLVGAFIALIVAGALAFLAFQQSTAARRAEAAAVDAQKTAIIQVTQVAQAQANAENNLVTAEAAGTEAARQADNASTQQAVAQTQAANAVDAQGQAEENLGAANIRGTEAALNLVTAEAAGTEAAAQANNASTQQAIAQVEAANALAAQSTSDANAAASRSLALAGSANDLLGQNSPLALFLAMEANRGLNEDTVSPLSRRVLSLAAFSAPRDRFEVGVPVTSVLFLPFAGVSSDDNPIPAGLQAVSGTADGRIMLWDIREGTSETLEGGHTLRVNELALNPANPNMLASVGDDGVGIIWSISDRIEARRLASGSSNVPARTIAFNTEGTRVAIGYADGNVVIFDTNGSQISQLPEVSNNTVNSIVFRPDTSNDMVIAFDDTTRYWDAGLNIFIPFDLGNILARLGKVQAVAFSTDADTVLTSNAAPLFFLSEVPFGEEAGDSVLTSQSDAGNRPQLWSIDVDNLVRENNNVRPTRLSYPEHLGQVTNVTYSPNGDFIVSTAADGSVFLVDAGGGQLVRRLLAHEALVWDAAFSSDGRFILTGGADNVMYLWDFNTNIGIEETYDSTGEGDIINASVSQVRFTENGRIFAGSDRGEVALWEYENYTPQFAQPLVDSEVPQVVYRVLETTDETTGEPVIRLLTGSLDMRLYDMASGAILASYDRDEATAFVNDIAITSDGRLAVWAGGYFERVESREALNHDIRIPILTLWDTQTGEVVRNFDIQSVQTEVAATPSPTAEDTAEGEDGNEQVDNSITAAAIFPDGTKLVTGDEFGRIIIWDMNTGEQLAELEGHTDIVSVLRFSDDGTQLLSGSADRIIILWRIDADVSRSFQQRRFIGHTDLINDVDFSPVDTTSASTRNTIVSGSEDRRVIQWDATTGEILQILTEQSTPITTVQFTPDGTGVVFGTLDGRVVFKKIDSPEEIITWAQANRYVPELTCSQAEQYNVAVEGCEGGS